MESRQLLAVGDLVWHDLNANGLQDANEPGLAGIEVRLLQQSGEQVASAVTDSDGRYQLPVETAGDYFVEVSAPSGWYLSGSFQGDDPLKDSDVDPESGRTPLLTFAVGEEQAEIDAGLFRWSSIRGRTYVDVNQSDTIDESDTRMAGVDVYLDLNNNGRHDQNEPLETSDQSGVFRFPEMPPGEYVLREKLTAGYRQTVPGSAGGDYFGTAYEVNTGRLQLVQIDSDTGVVTWIGNPMSRLIHGMVVTNSGQIYGMNGEGVTDEIYQIDRHTGQLTLIGDSGYSMIWGLAYDPLTDTIYGAGRTGDNDPNHHLLVINRQTGQATAVGEGVPPLSGGSGLAFDPVNRRVLVFANTTDEYVAFDLQGNGARLSGATPPLDSFAMAHDGQYVIQQLREGTDRTRLIKVDPETGVREGVALTISSNSTLESLDLLPGIPDGYRVQLLSGRPSTLDFANTFEGVGEIQGSVWNDVDGDQNRGAGEPALAGVRIYLDLNHNRLLDGDEPVEVSDANGNYRFAELSPGSYEVRQASQAGQQTFPASEPDAYYATAHVTPGGPGQLVSIDPATGQVDWIGSPMSTIMHGLAVTNDGQIYGMNGLDDSIYSVDSQTGQVSRIGASGYSLAWGLAYDAESDTIYGLGRDFSGQNHFLMIIDRATGAATPVGAGSPQLFDVSSLAFDAAAQRLIAYDNGSGQYHAFDTAGNWTRLGHSVPRVLSYAMTFDGQNIVQQAVNEAGNRNLVAVNPDSGLRDSVALLLSSGVVLEALDFAEGGDGQHRVLVSASEIVTGVDFGVEGGVPLQVMAVEVNAGLVDPPDLSSGPQPSSWADQRSELRNIRISFNRSLLADVTDFTLVNLGVDAPAEADSTVGLSANQITIVDHVVTIDFASQELPDGVYSLRIQPSLTDLSLQPLDGDGDNQPGGVFVHQGSVANRFFQLRSDFNADAGVSIFDFGTFAYWFGLAVDPSSGAPEYVDLNRDGGISIFDFPDFAAKFGTGIVAPAPLAASAAAVAVDFRDNQLQGSRTTAHSQSANTREVESEPARDGVFGLWSADSRLLPTDLGRFILPRGETTQALAEALQSVLDQDLLDHLAADVGQAASDGIEIA